LKSERDFNRLDLVGRSGCTGEEVIDVE
jgi:hypothetical protein